MLRGRRPARHRHRWWQSAGSRRQVRTRARAPLEPRSCIILIIMLTVNPSRTIAELKELRALTADDNGAQRIAWTDTWLKAREWFSSKLAGLPVEDHYDAAGNRWITLPGASKKALIL